MTQRKTMCLDVIPLRAILRQMRINKLDYCRILLPCFLTVFAVSCSRPSQKTETVTINNVEPRRDVTGHIIDAHCGCLQFFNGRFYLYGRAFGTNHTGTVYNLPFVVYSSPDLKDWTFEGKLLREQPKGVYTRPYVVFNPKTRKYVLWYNWFPTLWNGQDGVAVSDNPVGPFTIVNTKVHLLGSCPGDSSLFVDDDGTGYCIYTDMDEGYAIRVERLTPDFLDSTGQASNVLAKGNEAPLLFRRDNIYYALVSPLCPDCPEGGSVQVFKSASPLGPFTTKLEANINRQAVKSRPIVAVHSGNFAKN
jgi:beta-xylosidase